MFIFKIGHCLYLYTITEDIKESVTHKKFNNSERNVLRYYVLNFLSNRTLVLKSYIKCHH